MFAKTGTLQERRDALFTDTPAATKASCPFKNAEIAIVPMRYALDRSHYDVDPAALTPLSPRGKWAFLPPLKTRTYTLRQLREGYVYVFDETANTLHEYSYSAVTALLTRILWDESEIGLDQRSNSNRGVCQTHLLYPRSHQLYIAFSPQQWTWRTCEHLRSHAKDRAQWMQALDLKEYSGSLSVPHALPLMQLAKKAVADIDAWPIADDGRFADSAHPPKAIGGLGETRHAVPLAADVLWTGTVDDKFSSVLIALNDPLAVMEDLGMQLAADQAALQEWQDEHEHKLGIAGIVEQLCGAGSDRSLLPKSALRDESATREYVALAEKYFEQLKVEEDSGAMTPGTGLILGLNGLPSTEIGNQIYSKYHSRPDPKLRESWENRQKWRLQADHVAARSFAETQQPRRDALRQQLSKTQHDLRTWAEHIGTEPLKLFVDTTHPDSLLYLQSLIAGLLEILGQDLTTSRWMMEEELHAKSLFGVARFGFSVGLKAAFDAQVNDLIQDHNDINGLFSRASELNALLGHDAIANHPWMKALSEPIQNTFKAMGDLVKGAGKHVLEKTLLALLAADSRLASGKSPHLGALLRNLAIGNFLMGHPNVLKSVPDFAKRLMQWKQEMNQLRAGLNGAQYRFTYQRDTYNARSLGRAVADADNALKVHALKLPLLFEFEHSPYLKSIQEGIAASLARGGLAADNWLNGVRAWSEKRGLNAGAFTYAVIISNLINTALVYRDLSKDGELSGKDWVKLTSAAAYTGSALMGLFVETKWGGMKDLSTVVDGGTLGIMKKSANYWTHSQPGWGSLIRGFGARLVGLGAFTLVATFTETWDISDDITNASSLGDKKLLWIKAGAVVGMSLVGILQLTAGSMALAGNPALLALAMNPYIAGGALAVGLIYLLATLALNYLKRDAVGQWLRKGSWSRHPEDLAGSQITHLEENRSFLEIQLSPTLHVKPTYEYIERYTYKKGHEQIPIQNGAWVQLLIPAELQGSVIQVNVIASHRPYYVGTVEKAGHSLQKPFIDNGEIIAPSLLGKTPDESGPKKRIESCHPIPAGGEGIIWQAWVPLTVEAQFIEAQVWYPAEILANAEGDRGFRFQLELVGQGVTDEKDTLMSSLDTKNIQVQTLGGRDDATALAVPGWE
ncbi:T6SS effector BTH_I2691 family protein [Pseudomonas sp. CCI3.2]|uniref:T6SS effector BTH_I2691 family protein n=1 Tax=unclassified Pseudomonas TaxID=196821 RepID=UPI002AC8C891|nr:MULTISPECIES: T6SS effector BTH_I2691 family protein [unclassified Pseudomonas]MEB0077860.1 T6SS effector BTH_I2691 family protein [Pseudomonas sp. MH10out]MEB0102842.1 T6SS effector BTH_I2691 family protein [Pseudomonas sp. CCI3.2]MEB0131680.1 T6SS effector BTH_I2691 family protein [Pseudomonas sp. CCI2.4]MEB0159537.1 T6SS effector BTH_I2691 family protein [Pseudomonas sp. AH2 (2023)]MEB0169740.1 T6SS effector BTH_I2691 family protein [Pseudomonas sp. CCC4.4]